MVGLRSRRAARAKRRVAARILDTMAMMVEQFHQRRDGLPRYSSCLESFSVS